ncbi:MAG: 16S rRNA (cytosine(967)-C(5))-methyltransferase RsmB [Xanthomonadaceae bacterium]|nr:16S rRNA (cytosine(967)-C(5))-methyltransferase RsmB [Xanthomonadaceae bacterium]
MNDSRALAALALAEVALRGASLREVQARTAPALADPRDRALLAALLHEGARYWLRYDALLARLLERPLRTRLPALHALLILGLVQIERMRLPEYAAVAATVEAARALGHGHQSGLINAVLRRFLRERAALTAALDADATTRHALPGWLLEAIERDWPDSAAAVLATINVEAPPTLRVNRRRADRDTTIAALAAAGHAARAHPWLPDAVLLDASTDVTRLPGWSEGAIAVQDGAAQIAAGLLDVTPGLRVLDACAAPGGKTCHLLERTDLDLLALDREPERLARIAANLERLGLTAILRAGDAAQPAAWWDGRPFDRILLDAPCSATGVLRRQPDVRLHRRATDMATLAQAQRGLLDALWPLLAPGGRLLYATCSLLRAENSAVTTAFAARHGDAEGVPIVLPAGRADGPGWQILPGEDGLDGMYYAAFTKRAGSSRVR